VKRRRLIWSSVVLVLGAGGLVVGLDPDRRVLGWARGEPFFQGRAASAWRRDLRQSEDAGANDAFSSLVAGKADAVPVCSWVLRTATEAEARWRAVDVIGKIGKDAAPAAPDVVAALSDGDPLVRRVAVRVIGEMTPDVAGVIPALVALFPDVEAIRAVARFGPRGSDGAPSLRALFTHEDPTVRWQAVRAIGKIGEPALAAMPELIRLTASDPDPLVREHAAEALGDIGPAAAEGIPALVKALHDPIARVRRDAVRALGQMGPAAKGALLDVREAIQDPDADVKTAATRAARLIDPMAVKR
jgi:HEAT repeat protein